MSMIHKDDGMLLLEVEENPECSFSHLAIMLWAKSLKKGDELDVRYKSQTYQSYALWCVGTVKNRVTFVNKKKVGYLLQIEYNAKTEWLSLPSQISSISKLHRHTACNQCMILNNKYAKYRNYTIKCKDCELKPITTAIENANIDILYYDIIQIIAEYSVGFVINCSNNIHNCNNQIIIGNESEFWRNKKKYTYCNVEDQFCDKYVVEKCNAVQVAGRYRRFSCGICATQRCKAKYCRYSDTERICFNHHKCCTCLARLSRLNLHLCKNYTLCNNYFCDKLGCGSEAFCKMCMVARERNNICKALMNGCKDLEMKIINVIIEYSMGIIIECNNCECRQEIVLDNKFEFEYVSKKKMIYYSPKHIKLFSSNEITLIYGKTLRIFCLKCVRNSLVTLCKYRDGANRARCINFDCKAICGDHAACSECKMCTNKVCKQCKEFCCKKVECCYKGECKTCIVKKMSNDHRKCMQLKGEGVWRSNLIICKACNRYCCRRKRCSVNGRCKTCICTVTAVQKGCN